MTVPVLRNLLLALSILTAACAINPAAKFLPTTNPAWDTWLNTVVDIDRVNVPLSDLTRQLFPDLNPDFIGIDGETLVSLQAEHVTRRQALSLLADKYGLAMTLTAKALVIENRETAAHASVEVMLSAARNSVPYVLV